MAMLKKQECQDMILAGDFGTGEPFGAMCDFDFAKKFADLWTCTFPPLSKGASGFSFLFFSLHWFVLFEFVVFDFLFHQRMGGNNHSFIEHQ